MKKILIVSILCLSLFGCATTGNLSSNDPQKEEKKESWWTWILPEGPLLQGLVDSWVWY